MSAALLFGSAAAMPSEVIDDNISISASAEQIGDYITLDDGTLEINKFYDNKAVVSIPSTIAGKTVSSIGSFAFNGAVTLQEVVIPSTVKKMGGYVFEDCVSLTKANIPGSVKTWGYSTFENCIKLSQVSLGEGINQIPPHTFNGCSSLKSITIPNSVLKIGFSAFENCTALTSVTIGSGVTYIDSYAFENCTNLKSVIIPNNVRTIDIGAFKNCSSLQSVTIPKSVTDIRTAAFKYCSSNLTIYCYKNSAAHTYAVKNKIKYVLLDNHTHSYSAWTTARNATPTVRGYMIRKCTICGSSQTKPIIYYERLAGSERYATAAALSKKSYTTSGTVVLASGMDYHDALAAVPLAKAYNAPLLLTATNSMPPATLAEIKRLKATKIVIVYTKGAIGNNVLSALGSYSKEIITGNSYYQTAANVATRLKSKVTPTNVFFVYANGFADALSASHVAAIRNAPIIYVNTNGIIDSASKAYLASVKGTVKNAFIIGGTGVISESMKKTIAAQLPNAGITRFGGANRYETNYLVNNAFKANLTGADVSVATGKSFPDALCGGLYAANKKIPLVLADQVLSTNQKNLLKARKAVAISVIGGLGVVPATMVQAIRDASA